MGEGDDAGVEGEWKPEACFTAVDVEYGGKVVDLTRNITRGPLQKIPGEERMWRVPHHVKVCRFALVGASGAGAGTAGAAPLV